MWRTKPCQQWAGFSGLVGLPEGVEGVLVGVVTLDLGDAPAFHADELTARHVEVPSLVLGRGVLDRDDVISPDRDVDESGVQRAA
ncbi:MAG: hypothetical protein QOF59_2129, partial [Actinomycetota bacterium]|nr:hypothetical protein [Actinomycetota bacterium]